MLLDDAINEYKYYCLARNFTKKTMKNKNQEYKQLINFLTEKRGIEELESITSHDLDAYIRTKRQKGLKAQSIVSMSKQVKAFFNWCVTEEYITENPMDKVTLPKLPKKILTGLTNEEVVQMLNCFNNSTFLEVRNKAIIAMMSDCGLRAMEIANLKSKNVRETDIKINGKGRKERIIFISPALKKFLIRYERLKKQYFKDKIQYNDNYFLAYQGKALSTVAVYNLVIEASKRVGIEGKRVSPHMFRHYFAVQSILAGNDIYVLSRWLGHSSVTTTQIYLESLEDYQLSKKAVSTSPLMNLHKRDE